MVCRLHLTAKVAYSIKKVQISVCLCSVGLEPPKQNFETIEVGRELATPTCYDGSGTIISWGYCFLANLELLCLLVLYPHIFCEMGTTILQVKKQAQRGKAVC